MPRELGYSLVDSGRASHDMKRSIAHIRLVTSKASHPSNLTSLTVFLSLVKYLAGAVLLHVREASSAKVSRHAAFNCESVKWWSSRQN
jgi:hypothetical protein